MFDYKDAWEKLEQKLTKISDYYTKEHSSSEISKADALHAGGVTTGLLLAKQYMFDILIEQVK